MTAPQEITHASRQYEDFASDLKQQAMLQTHNQVYAMTRAVLHETRDHLSLEQAIGICQGLPAVPRAIFVEGWNAAVPAKSLASKAEFSASVVKRLTPHHIPPETIVDDVVSCIEKHADPAAFRQGVAWLAGPLATIWHA